MNIEQSFRALAGAGAGWILWLLVSLSVIGAAIMLERLIMSLRTRDDIARLKREVVDFLADGRIAEARTRLAESRAYEARVVAAALEASPRGAAAAEERMAAESQSAKLDMEKRLAFLGTVGSNAPFVGLLGTVIGIVRAFRALHAAGGQMSTALMSEIGEALVATAVGLLVAIPAVAAFNVFSRVIMSRLARADAFGREVMSFLKTETPIIPRSAGSQNHVHLGVGATPAE
jgi:biopolymer transport protein ExbB